MVLVTLVYQITSKFPKVETFGLVDQLRRAATSIVLNITEGSGSGSDLEFKRFLYIALRSLYELIAGFEIALNLRYISYNEYQDMLSNVNELGAMINGLINKLKKANSKQLIAKS